MAFLTNSLFPFDRALVLSMEQEGGPHQAPWFEGKASQVCVCVCMRQSFVYVLFIGDFPPPKLDVLHILNQENRSDEM